MRREIHVALRRRKESNTKRYTLSGVGRENEVTLLSPFPPTRFQTSCFGDSWKFSDRGQDMANPRTVSGPARCVLAFIR